MGYTRFRNSIKVCKGVHIYLNKDSVGCGEAWEKH